MTQDVLAQPVPIVFAVCQGVQQLANGTFNLLGIFDMLTVYELPDGTRPDSIALQVVTVWTGGVGSFQQRLRMLDEDGNQLMEMQVSFSLDNTSHRNYMVSMVAIPLRPGLMTIVVARGDDELLRQDFRVTVAPFPGQSVP